MRQWIRSHLTYANVMATLAVFLVLGGMSYAATGGTFILGKSNSASSKTSLTAPVAGKGLEVTNTSTGAGATALGLNVASGHAPFAVNSGTKVTNLNADKLDGLNSTAFLPSSSVKRLEYFAPLSGGAPAKFATVGPYDIYGECANNPGAQVLISALGPAGTADVMWDETKNDATDEGSHSNGLLIPANTRTEFASSFATGAIENAYYRIAGTAMLRSGSVTLQLDFNAVGDNRNPGNCFIYGTAMKAT